MKNENERSVCRLCLIRDISEERYQKEILSYLDRIHTADRAEEELYEQRLNVCRTCNDLVSATCMRCGCYVELRAALKRADCPHVPSRWKEADRKKRRQAGGE